MKKLLVNIGDQFDNIKVIDFLYESSHKIAVCECICGNIINKQSSSLPRIKRHNCGCIPLWKNNCIGQISKTFFCRIKQGADRRGLQFDIIMEYIWNLYEKQNRKCALTGLPIIFGENGPHDRETSSLDRIDSSIGYIEGNVWWVHRDINQMKFDFSVEKFIYLCSQIAKNNP